MADPVNNFAPLTPEQEAMLSRQAIQESVNPLDFIAPGAALLGGGAMYGFGRALGLPRLPSLAGGGVFGANLADRIENNRNTRLDAEGQPGGFYGENPRARIMRELMK